MFKLIREEKLNENEESLIKALKILFDNSTLSDVKKVIQAKRIANSLGLDEKQLVNESKKLNEELAVNCYVVYRPQYLASDDTHEYSDVTFNRTDAALFTEYEDAIDAAESINSKPVAHADGEFEIRKLGDLI